MNHTARIALVGDRSDAIRSHCPYPWPAGGAAGARDGLALDAYWIPTQDAGQGMDGFDAVWVLPAVPTAASVASWQRIGPHAKAAFPFWVPARHPARAAGCRHRHPPRCPAGTPTDLHRHRRPAHRRTARPPLLPGHPLPARAGRRRRPGAPADRRPGLGCRGPRRGTIGAPGHRPKWSRPLPERSRTLPDEFRPLGGGIVPTGHGCGRKGAGPRKPRIQGGWGSSRYVTDVRGMPRTARGGATAARGREMR